MGTVMGTVAKSGTVFRRSSDGLWVGRIEAGWGADGKRRRVQVTAKTESACRTRLAAKRRDIERDGAAVAGIGRATVKAWADRWLPEHQRHVRPKAYATDASAVRRWIVPTIGRRILSDLTPADMRAVRDAILTAGLSTSTALRVHSVLTTMLKSAIVEGHAVPDRVLKVPRPVKAATDRDAIPLPHAAEIITAAAARPGAARWLAALLQGMRQAECLGMEWDAIDLAAGTLTISWQLQPLPYLHPSNRAAGFRIPEGYEVRHLHRAYHLVRPKTGAGRRVVPLAPYLRDALDEHWQAWLPNPWGLLWTATDARYGRVQQVPVRSSDDRAAWYAVQDAAGVRHASGRRYTLHEARHTTATLLMELGVDETVRRAILGHSSITSTRGYQHANLQQQRRAMESLAERLGVGAGASEAGLLQQVARPDVQHLAHPDQFGQR